MPFELSHLMFHVFGNSFVKKEIVSSCNCIKFCKETWQKINQISSQPDDLAQHFHYILLHRNFWLDLISTSHRNAWYLLDEYVSAARYCYTHANTHKMILKHEQTMDNRLNICMHPSVRVSLWAILHLNEFWNWHFAVHD